MVTSSYMDVVIKSLEKGDCSNRGRESLVSGQQYCEADKIMELVSVNPKVVANSLVVAKDGGKGLSCPEARPVAELKDGGEDKISLEKGEWFLEDEQCFGRRWQEEFDLGPYVCVDWRNSMTSSSGSFWWGKIQCCGQLRMYWGMTSILTPIFMTGSLEQFFTMEGQKMGKIYKVVRVVDRMLRERYKEGVRAGPHAAA
ncbi:hypothetical protein SUGI_0471560 [Cryptomeria japonica]|nr:hypothetical protein SUGI_0471560 [Cryptomeria japonica]